LANVRGISKNGRQITDLSVSTEVTRPERNISEAYPVTLMTGCSIIIHLPEQLVFAPINTRRLVMFVIGKWISPLPTTMLVEEWFLNRRH
jgi:hypothetical protein